MSLKSKSSNSTRQVRKLLNYLDYELSEQLIYRWVRKYEGSGSFEAAENRSDEENELIRLRKEVQQLKMENDILK